MRGTIAEPPTDAVEADPAGNAELIVSFALRAWPFEPCRATPIVATEIPIAAKAARTHRIWITLPFSPRFSSCSTLISERLSGTAEALSRLPA